MADSTGWVLDYAKLLASPEPDAWEQARTLKRTHMPKHLFRYRSPTPLAFKDLFQGSIWLAAPRHFNDPFDSAFGFDGVERAKRSLNRRPRNWISRTADPGAGLAPLPQEVRDELEASEDPASTLNRLFVARIAALGGSEAAARADGFIERVLSKGFSQIGERLSEANQRGLKVACFSETATSLPLWAYYTENHRGFCVEYPVGELPPTEPQFRMLHPVIYASQRAALDALIGDFMVASRPNPFLATLAAMHKSADWSHEREWRIVNPLGDFDSPGVEIGMPKPSRVLLGKNMAADYKHRLLVVAAAYGIPVYGTALSHDRFELEAVPLSENTSVATGPQADGRR